MKVLYAIWDGGGNTAPQLAIIAELAERGHDVRVLGNPCQRQRIEASGARFLPYVHAPDNDASRPETDLIRDWEAKTPQGAFARVRDRLMYGPAALFARDVSDALDDEPADVIAWDYLLMGVAIGAERAGVPSVAVVHTVFPLPRPGVPPFGLGLMPAESALARTRDALLRRLFRRTFAPGMKAANAARAELGLEPMEGPFDLLATAGRVLVMTSAEFDFGTGRGALPANVSYPGAVVPPASAGAWDSPWRADDERPLVVASLSTTFMDQQTLAQHLVDALGALPVRGLFTAGPAIDAASLDPPANVAVRQFVPHAAVLPEAALMVSHCGMGTVHAALAAGVPLVCIPGGRDQPDVAARVVAAGAGVRLGQRASAARLRAAIQAALGDPELRDGARRLSVAFARDRGAAQAAEEIEGLAGLESPNG